MKVIERRELQVPAGMQDWLMDVAACPQCKEPLMPLGNTLHCELCRADYAVENGIPSLLPAALSVSLQDGHEPVKNFYYQEEHYDWTCDPKGLELAYHRYRKWETWRRVAKHLRPGIIALDMGCGTGLITYEFRKRFQRVVALDLNRWALGRMDGKPFVVKVQGDGESLPIQDGSIDLIVATEMIEHLEKPEKAAGEMFRVLKWGGIVVGSVPSTSNIWKWREHLSLTCGGGEPFHHNFTKEEITRLMENAGFQVSVSSGCLGLNWLWTLRKV